MIYFVDIDGTICTQAENNDYSVAKPIWENIAKINSLYVKGNRIIYHTARGTKSGIQWWSYTMEQLRAWGCLFHELRMGKPYYDVWIDDKSMRIEEL